MSGKAVIVTGGTRGIGRGISLRFLEHGADVVMCARRDAEEPVEGGGRRAVFVEADVKQLDDIQRVVDVACERFGRIDVLINTAGGAPAADAATVSPRFSESIVQLNLMSALHFCQKANEVMQEQETGGAIVNIASVSAIRPSPGTAAYGAAKAGIISLTQTLAVEWAPKVRVNAVTAGMIQTELAHLHYGDEAGIAKVAATVPLGRLGTPGDVGDTCLYLTSALASYVSGANILLHGAGERPAFLEAAEPLPGSSPASSATPRKD
jgi:NAD(P)-dependent dehydrogenase (short-subunit alcohol dehydrogenase family)